MNVKGVMADIQKLRFENDRLKARGIELEREAASAQEEVFRLNEELLKTNKSLRRFKVEVAIVLAPATLITVLLFLAWAS